MGAGSHVTPPISEMVKSGELCGVLGFVVSTVTTYLSPATSLFSEVAQRNNVRILPFQCADPAVAPSMSHADLQKIPAAGPPRKTVAGVGSPASCMPSISNPGVSSDNEYAIKGEEPLTSTPDCSVIVIVFGEEV
jgi:hypothetical protein